MQLCLPRRPVLFWPEIRETDPDLRRPSWVRGRGGGGVKERLGRTVSGASRSEAATNDGLGPRSFGLGLFVNLGCSLGRGLGQGGGEGRLRHPPLLRQGREDREGPVRSGVQVYFGNACFFLPPPPLPKKSVCRWDRKDPESAPDDIAVKELDKSLKV